MVYFRCFVPFSTPSVIKVHIIKRIRVIRSSCHPVYSGLFHKQASVQNRQQLHPEKTIAVPLTEQSLLLLQLSDNSLQTVEDRLVVHTGLFNVG